MPLLHFFFKTPNQNQKWLILKIDYFLAGWNYEIGSKRSFSLPPPLLPVSLSHSNPLGPSPLPPPTPLPVLTQETWREDRVRLQMVKRKTKKTLPETKRRLMREQERRTETRIKQLLSPVKQEDSDTEEDWTEIVARLRREVRQKLIKRRWLPWRGTVYTVP